MLTLTYEKHRLLIRGSLNARHFDLLNKVPGRMKWRNREFLAEDTAANLEYLLMHFRDDLDISPDVQVRLAEIEKRRREEEHLREAKIALPPEADYFGYKTRPYEHQKKAFVLSRDRREFALFMEMGTGKTKVLIDTAAYLYAKGEIDGLLVFAPNGVHRQWIEEQIPLHLPDWCPRKLLLYKGSKKTPEQINKLKGDGLKIMAMNVEALSSGNGEAYAKQFLSLFPSLLAIDESTRIKTPGAGRTKAAHRLGKLARFRRIMSGAPVTKGVEDLFSQLRFLDEDVLGYSSFYTFRNNFCVMGGFEQRQIVGYKNLPELLTQLDGVSFQVKKADCLDLPEKVYVTREVELTKQQKDIYTALKDEFMATLADGTMITADLAIVRLLRMQQVICGFVTKEDGTVENLDSNRMEAVVDVIEQTRGKTIIWARFQHDIDHLRRQFGARAVVYDGRVAEKDRELAKQKFLHDPDCTIFIGNPAAAGTGLNLVVANTVIYYSNSFDADLRWQSEDRCHRIGQKNSVTYVDVVAKGTIDRKIVRALQAKKSVADIIAKGDIKALLAEAD